MTADSEAPIVLVHGMATSNARTWGETGWFDLLADAGRDVHPIDLPGHGSAKDLDDQAAYDDLERYVLDRLPDEPVDAVGFSMGAGVLLRVAAAHPDRFNRIIVAGVGKNLFTADEGRGEAIANAIAGEQDPEDPQARHFHALADAPDVNRDNLLRLMRRESSPLTPDMLASVTCPVLVVLGDQDFAGPADPLTDALPNAQLVTLRGVDHFATPKDFGFLDAGLEFLDAAP